MNASALVLLPDSLGAPPDDVPVRWRLFLIAAGEPLLLTRVLQKIAVPEIALRSTGYDPDESGVARIALVLPARPARARLAATRLQRIIGVEAVVPVPAN